MSTPGRWPVGDLCSLSVSSGNTVLTVRVGEGAVGGGNPREASIKHRSLVTTRRGWIDTTKGAAERLEIDQDQYLAGCQASGSWRNPEAR